MKSRRRCILGLVFTLAGCSGEDVGADGEIPRYPYVTSVDVAGCAVPDACDVLSVPCQQQWMATLGCLRGRDPMSVPIRIIDKATFESELAADPPEPRPVPDHWERAFVMLGFVQPGAFQPAALSTERVENAAAYYQSEIGEITIVGRGLPADGITQNSVLVHELVHAAQDQELGLEPFLETYATSSDSSLAARALIEGEASLYDTLVAGALNGIDVGELDLATIVQRKREFMLESALEAPSPYVMAQYTLPYGLGEPFVERAFSAGGADAIRELYDAPPLSVRQLLLLDLSGEQALAPADQLDVEALSAEGFVHDGWDSLGVLGLLLYGGAAQRDTMLKLGAALRSDRLDVLASGFETALVWQLAFTDVASAQEFLASYDGSYSSGPGSWYDLGGGALVFVAAGDLLLQSELARALGL